MVQLLSIAKFLYNAGLTMVTSEKRVNIGPAAREFRAHGYSPDVFVPRPEGYDERGQIKPEVYALTAVITDRAVRRAFGNRNVTRMVDSLDGADISFGIKRGMRIALVDATQETVEEAKADEDKRMRSVIERVDELLPDWDTNRPELSKYINPGITTAVLFMGNTIGAIPILAKKEKNPQALVEIAENSYPFLAKWASVHFNDMAGVSEATFIPHPDSVLNEYFRPSDFAIVAGSNGRKRLDLSEEGEAAVEKAMSRSLPEEVAYQRRIGTPLVRCPAMVDFGEGPAVQTLWKWHVEVARELYPRLYQASSMGIMRRIGFPFHKK